MLLSKEDQKEFKELYKVKQTKALAKIYDTNITDIISTAKFLGIYESKQKQKRR